MVRETHGGMAPSAGPSPRMSGCCAGRNAAVNPIERSQSSTGAGEDGLNQAAESRRVAESDLKVAVALLKSR